MICSVDKCGGTARGRGMCQKHYFRWYRTGDAGEAESRQQTYEPGQRCFIKDCGKPARQRGWCNMHYTRWLRHGDPLAVKPQLHHSGPSHVQWQGDNVGYNAIHCRLRVRRTLTACAMCGAVATHWAYDHADPNECHEKMGNSLVAYSTELSHYFPACVPCHKRFDLLVRSGQPVRRNQSPASTSRGTIRLNHKLVPWIG